MICPCKGCEDRTIKCHSVCERYKAYREEIDRINSARRSNYGDIVNYTVTRDAKIKRRLGIK